MPLVWLGRCIQGQLVYCEILAVQHISSTGSPSSAQRSMKTTCCSLNFAQLIAAASILVTENLRIVFEQMVHFSDSKSRDTGSCHLGRSIVVASHARVSRASICWPIFSIRHR